MAITRYKINIRVAWWYRAIYLPALYLMYRAFQVLLSEEGLKYWTRKAMKVRGIHAIQKQ